MNKTELKKLYAPKGMIMIKDNVLYSDYMVLDLSFKYDNEKIVEYIKKNQIESSRIRNLQYLYEPIPEPRTPEFKEYESKKKCYFYDARKSPFDNCYKFEDFYICEDIIDFIVKLFYRDESSPNIY